ncbi:MAG: PEP-CTERM sorting domain-containing protein [Acidobacteria bacterium]|nr:PEP-CTERM sorting domain-containing protein [Acidobacteriota bacterium]
MIRFKKSAVLTTVAVVLLGVGPAAGASVIVNIDARSNLVFNNPKTVFLAAGVYQITPVGTAGGGIYDAWSAFAANAGCQPSGECTAGWEAEYEFASASLPFTLIGNSPVKYATPLQALAHAVSTTIMLPFAQTVNFGINDCNGCLGDNRGGNSLLIERVVPEPSTWMAAAAGLALLVRLRRR